MKKEIKEKWIEALRSGNYAQGQGELHNPDNKTYCCLGVLADVTGHDPIAVKRLPESGNIHAAEEYLNYKVLDEVGLSHSAQQLLANMNDGFGNCRAHSFAEIADYIESNL
jgi:hypothetical protein